MQEIKVKSLVHDIHSATDATKDQLDTSERIIRITIMSAFIGILAIEAWLLWQVFQLL